MRNCDECGMPFEAPGCAPHKRFCSPAHRLQWHERQRRQRLAAIRASQMTENEAQAESIASEIESHITNLIFEEERRKP